MMQEEQDEILTSGSDGAETSHGFRKICSRFADSFVGTMLLAVVLLSVGSLLGVCIYELMDAYTDIEPSVWQTMGTYVYFIGIWIVFIIYMLLTKKNRPILKALGPWPKGNSLRGLGTGLLIGFTMNLMCAVVAMANKDITLYFSSFDIKNLLIVFIVVFIQSGAEELMCRVFIYQRLVKRYKNVWFAATLNSVLFVALHLSNPGFTWISATVIMLSGLIFSAMVIYMDSSWAPMGAHAAWNYTQNILLGLPNSGLVVPFSVCKVDAVSESWAYSVKFGLEGSITAIVVQMAVLVILIVWGVKHKKQPYDVWVKQNHKA
jgi:uncharacterized protein